MDYEAIRTYYQTMINNNGLDGEVMSKLASSMVETRDFESALEILKRAVEIDPCVQTLSNLGYFYLNIGEPSQGRWFYKENETVELLERAIKLNPISYYPYAILGEAYIKLNKIQLAQKVLQKAVACKETLANHNNLGVVLYKLKKIEEASIYFHKAHSMGDDLNYSFNPYISYGICLARLGDADKAYKVAQDLMKKYKINLSGEVDGIDISKILYMCNKYEDVVEVFSQEIDNVHVSPSDFSLYMYSQYQLKNICEVERMLNMLIKEKEEEIYEVKDDNDISIYNKKYRINNLEQEIKQLLFRFQSIDNGVKPYCDFDPVIEKDCCFFGCIRHNIPYMANKAEDMDLSDY
ncbi:MAG: hypothetical protein PHD60_09725 [Clostridia bacterium]|nr:hypothetical protein [Clostridia bacterium]